MPTAVDTLRVKDGYAYVASEDDVISRYALAGGEAELVGQGGPWFELDGSHVYYLPPFDDDSSTVRRRNKAGGGEESSDNLFDPPIWRPKTFVLTDNHIVAFQDEKIVAVPKGNLNDARILGSAYADFATFDGTNVIWLTAWSSSSEVRFEISALDVRAGNRHLAYSKRAQFVGEDWRLWGAICSHVFFQQCESTGHFCTTLRVSTEGGEPETFTALERSDDALDTVLVTPGGLFYVQDGNVLRLTAPEDEPTMVWHSEAEQVPKALAFDGTTLYVAAVSGETTTLWRVPQ